MKGYLNQHQIDYILFHLGILFELDDRVKEALVFVKDPIETAKYQNKIIFRLSEENLMPDSVKWIKDIPVLFPIDNSEDIFSESEGNIIFSDDLLKSAFYFLSGYQELACKEKDQFGRFPYSASIQKKLDIAGKPIVNYYFREIIRGIEQFCSFHGIPFKEKKQFQPFGFVLTHDIDRIEKYTWNYIGYKIKELLGSVKREHPWFKTLQLFLISIFGGLKLLKNKNPIWSFDYIMEQNRQYGFRSTYFFLPSDQKHTDADYKLDEKRLQTLYKKLLERGDEIGVHGTVASSHTLEKSKDNKRLLEGILKRKMLGIRQHRLCYKLPSTARIHQELEYVYDTTLGFAEQIGFRNSFCLPFKLYDFKNDCMFSHWQLPLNVMDVTLFVYQKNNFTQAEEVIRQLITEIQKFNGVFTLLWHNTNLDENEQKGIKDFYSGILKYLDEKRCQSFTAHESIEQIKLF